MSLQNSIVFFRGGTIYWETTFYDVNSQVVQPAAAFISIDFPSIDGSRNSQLVQMSPPAVGVVFWTVEIDTRNMGTGPVNWSVHSQGPIPVAVEDGSFQLSANPANLVNFS